MSDKIKFVIEKHIATIGTGTKGWTKELNLISWNGAKAKYDIRDWDADHDKMGKGVTLTEDEARLLASALSHEFGVPVTKGEAEEVPSPEDPKPQPKPKAEAKPQPKEEPKDEPKTEKVEVEKVDNPYGLPPEILAQVMAAKKAQEGK